MSADASGVARPLADGTGPLAGDLALVGVTASGKSALAMALARHLGDVEIVSVDSMQVYRGMDIGTAKASVAERAEVSHHMIDLLDPWEDCSVSWFADRASQALAEIHARGHRALLVGGTGLYQRAVVDGLEIPGRFPEVLGELEAEPDTLALHARLAELDPPAASRMEPSNRRRVLRALEVVLGSGRPFSSYGPGLDTYPPSTATLVGLHLERAEVDRRVVERFRAQIDAGFVEEVDRLLARPEGMSRTARQALGYREIAEHREGRSSFVDAVATADLRLRRFARRQERWFRRDPRITWIDAALPVDAQLEQVLTLLPLESP